MRTVPPPYPLTPSSTLIHLPSSPSIHPHLQPSPTPSPSPPNLTPPTSSQQYIYKNNEKSHFGGDYNLLMWEGGSLDITGGGWMLCDFIYLTPPIPWISTTQTLRSPSPFPPHSPSKPSSLANNPTNSILTSQPPNPTAKTPPPHAPSTHVFHSTPLHPHSIPSHPPTPLHPESSTRGADCLSVGGMLTYCIRAKRVFSQKNKKKRIKVLPDRSGKGLVGGESG